MVAILKYLKLINTREQLFKLRDDCWLLVKSLNGEQRFSNHQRKKFFENIRKAVNFFHEIQSSKSWKLAILFEQRDCTQ